MYYILEINEKLFNIYNNLNSALVHLFKLNECKLKCYYCLLPIFILYEIVRDSKQWTLDRIDNNKGHNEDNVLISCLECNLKRRRQSDTKFLFTKQLNLLKSTLSTFEKG